MSYVEIFAVRPNGDLELYGTARNAWGGAIHIWSRLMERYQIPAGPGLESRFEPLWNRCRLLDERDRWVLASTFDGVIIQREWLPTLIDHLASFAEEYGSSTLDQELALLRQAFQDEAVAGVCFNQTSVNGDTWRVPGTDDAAPPPYNIHVQSDHWFLTPSEFEEGGKAQ